MDKPNFETLRAERNASVLKHLEEVAAEFGCEPSALKHNYSFDACYCACACGGPCEHAWDGKPYESEDGGCWSATCSRCGGTAMSHSMRVGP